MYWFLYDNGLRHERVKVKQKAFFLIFKGVPLKQMKKTGECWSWTIKLPFR